jgi:hypothetical protein
MSAEAPLPDANRILPMKSVILQVIRCLYHSKESRYQVAYVESENIVIMTCLECPKGTELMRFKLARNGEDHAPRNLPETRPQ